MGVPVNFGDNALGNKVGYASIVSGTVSVQKVSFVSRLKYNLLSISQFCDKGHLD